ncbi:hypothetical protein DCAR_0520700 [Daucus carota subsp. sativus]|uniref:F-box domain-containing protein n=2 Tax=Daucus carota subsp. sativus TaxID=79200 RepID=A0AAF0X4P2_DAUCS|nr:hypothetical protein DCAR_0520700 [Daucus carota subsp. sativus]
MITIGAKRSRISKQHSPVSCHPDMSSSHMIASAVKVASNEDLLLEILLQVPIKTLMRFKSVSKQWLSLIANPYFVRLRSPLAPSASSLFFANSSCRSNPDYQFIPLDVVDGSLAPFRTFKFINDPLGSGVSALQSCNGLLLCASYRAREFNRRYYVYNPTTKQFATLPQIKREFSKTVCGMSLAFDPVTSPYYKVVCVRRSELRQQHFQIEIYSSETRVWKVSGEPFTAPKHTKFEKCFVHWGNALIHWNVWMDEPYTLYFKVDAERLEKLPMPVKHLETVHLHGHEKAKTYFGASYLGESGGHWNVVECNSNITCLLNVHEMARDYSGWFLKYQVDLNAISDVFPEIIKKKGDNRDSGYTFNVVSVVRSGNEENHESFVVLEIPGGMVVRYSLVDKRVKKLWEFTQTGYKFYNEKGLRGVCGLPYIQSLASV